MSIERIKKAIAALTLTEIGRSRLLERHADLLLDLRLLGDVAKLSNKEAFEHALPQIGIALSRGDISPLSITGGWHRYPPEHIKRGSIPEYVQHGVFPYIARQCLDWAFEHGSDYIVADTHLFDGFTNTHPAYVLAYCLPAVQEKEGLLRKIAMKLGTALLSAVDTRSNQKTSIFDALLEDGVLEDFAVAHPRFVIDAAPGHIARVPGLLERFAQSFSAELMGAPGGVNLLVERELLEMAALAAPHAALIHARAQLARVGIAERICSLAPQRASLPISYGMMRMQDEGFLRRFALAHPLEALDAARPDGAILAEEGILGELFLKCKAFALEHFNSDVLLDSGVFPLLANAKPDLAIRYHSQALQRIMAFPFYARKMPAYAIRFAHDVVAEEGLVEELSMRAPVAAVQYMPTEVVKVEGLVERIAWKTSPEKYAHYIRNAISFDELSAYRRLSPGSAERPRSISLWQSELSISQIWGTLATVDELDAVLDQSGHLTTPV